MSAEDKAKELVEKFMNIQGYINIENETYLDDGEGKQCALICVDEQIDFITEMISIDYNIRKIYINELEEVKQEIEKL